MDIKQLRIFQAVVQYGGFSKAAEKEYVSQATISYNISSLEKELNLQLIDRTEKSFTLTAAGIEYFNRATKILNDLEAAEREARNALLDKDSSIRLGYFARSCYRKLPGILRKLQEADPEIRIELLKDGRASLLEKLDRGDLDGIFINEFGVFNPYGQMTKKCLFDDSVALLMAADHPLAAKEKITLADLQPERILLLMEPESRNLMSELDLPELNIQPVSNTDDIVILVRSGYGIAFVDKIPFSHLPDDLTLREVENYRMYDNIYFYWKKNNERKSLARLIEILCNTSWEK